ncbi:hypothetical protein HNY73_023031 [Argiope bruennichi]|uniref:Uncharacterized protein n=1 Tax=Argiope bruennichi TaxID=94029 RepID=A0A8T0E3L1_ARGBR|nr:hypothetical protein HNY73_023031 [Argiope bruennichi]
MDAESLDTRDLLRDLYMDWDDDPAPRTVAILDYWIISLISGSPFLILVSEGRTEGIDCIGSFVGCPSILLFVIYEMKNSPVSFGTPSPVRERGVFAWNRRQVPLICGRRQPWIKEAVSGGRRYCRGLPDFFHYRFGTFHHLLGWSAVRSIILTASIIPHWLPSFFSPPSSLPIEERE